MPSGTCVFPFPNRHFSFFQITARGPLACGMCVTDEFEAYSGGIFHDTTGCTEEDHDISIAGFGEENGVKYWIGRNSWGTYW
jgi:cathepsin X